MNAPPKNDLLYGHLGEASYNVDTKEWRFSRIRDCEKSIKPLGTSCTTLPSTIPGTSTSIQKASTRNKNILHIVAANPTLAAAAELLPPLAQVSEVIIDSTSAYDSVVGALLGFGNARDLNRSTSGRRFIEIGAIAGGLEGDVLRLVRVGKKRFKCQGDIWAYVDAPSLERGEIGYWIGNGSPILQICFSTDVHILGSFLAVRCATVITLFRPVVQRWPVPPRTISLGQRVAATYSSSTLDANPFLFLPIEHTGGVPFADVTFNPWNEHQIALIDQQGRWSIWNIGRELKDRGPPALKVGSSGDLRDVLQNDADAENFDEDGWGCILWAGNPNTMLIANRRVLLIYDVKARPAMFNLNLVPEADWVLDVKRDARNPFLVCVLTSTRLIWLHVRTDIVEYGYENGDFTRMLLSWRHFRNDADTSLHLSLHSENSVTTVLVYSRLSILTTTFTFRISIDGIPQSLTDPYIWPTDDASFGVVPKSTRIRDAGQRLSTSTMVMRTAEGFLSPTLDMPEPEATRIYKNSRFYQLFSLQNDLSLVERVYHETPSRMPHVDFQAKNSSMLDVMTSARLIQNDFIVPDGLESEDENVPPSVHREIRHFRKEKFIIEEDPRTVNMTWLAKSIESARLNRPPAKAIGDDGFPSMSFCDVLEKVEMNAVSSLEAFGVGVKPLYELIEETVNIDNLDEISDLLKKFIKEAPDLMSSKDKDSAIVQMKVLPLFGSPNLSFQLNLENSVANTFLLDYYDELVKRWITPLHSAVPARIRVSLSRDLKNIASQICLTSFGLHKVSGDLSNFEETEPKDADGDETVLTVRRKISSGELPSKEKGKLFDGIRPSRRASPSLPGSVLPTPARTPSVHSQTSAFSPTDVEDEACQRLRALVRFEPQPPLTEQASKLLAHWQLGANPTDYDWEATKKALQTPESETDAETLRKQRKKSKKRVKEQQKADALSSQAALLLLNSSQFERLPTSSQMAGASLDHSVSQGVQGSSQVAGLGTFRKTAPRKVEKKRKRGF